MEVDLAASDGAGAPASVVVRGPSDRRPAGRVGLLRGCSCAKCATRCGGGGHCEEVSTATTRFAATLYKMFTKMFEKNVHLDFLDYWARGGIALGTHARRDCFGYPPAPDRPQGNNQLWLLDLDAGSEPEDQQQAHRSDRINRCGA